MDAKAITLISLSRLLILPSVILRDRTKTWTEILKSCLAEKMLINNLINCCVWGYYLSIQDNFSIGYYFTSQT